MIMPTKQICPKCGVSFEGSDAIGDICNQCEKTKSIKDLTMEIDESEQTIEYLTIRLEEEQHILEVLKIRRDILSYKIEWTKR